MKKVIFVALILVVLSSFSAYALGTALLDIRNKIFSESKEMRPLLGTSKDGVLISTMWDSCLIAITQLDAYFFMLGIFNTIDENNLTVEVADYLINWLGEIKRANDLNIKSLKSVSSTIDPATEVRIKKLTGYFYQVNFYVDADLKRISTLKESLKRVGAVAKRR